MSITVTINTPHKYQLDYTPTDTNETPTTLFKGESEEVVQDMEIGDTVLVTRLA